jgi:tail protein
MIKIDSIEFIDQLERSYRIGKFQIGEFPFTGGTSANTITTKVWNQHGNTFVDAYMMETNNEMTFSIFYPRKSDQEIVQMRREITDVCSPLNGIVTMKVTLNTGDVYYRDITFTAAPQFPIGAENRNRDYQKVRLEWEAHDPFWYSENEIVESFQSVEPLLEFPLESISYNDQAFSDFTGKIQYSTVENPNMFRYRAASTIGVPSDFTTEATQVSHQDKIKTIDGQTSTYTQTIAGNIPQMMWSFDVIQIIERKYGSGIWGGTTILADKIALAKSWITFISYRYLGFGSTPTGNKIILARYKSDDNTWYGNWSYNNTVITEHIISSSVASNNIDANGMIHLLAYTDASDGVTGSTLNTDYISLTLSITFPNMIKPIYFGNILPANIATNTGQVDSPVSILITGACTNPKITNLTTGEFIKLKNLTMISTDQLVIDTAFGQKKVELNGASIFNKLDPASTFFSLIKGDNEIDFSDDTGSTAAKIFFTFKELYISI